MSRKIHLGGVKSCRLRITHNLPEVQLSVFIYFFQIQSEYINHTVSGNPMSNRNQKNGVLKTKNGKIKSPNRLLFIGI